MELRPYQAAAVQNLRLCLARKIQRQVLYSPTGSGKTEISIAIIKGAMAKGKRVVFLCNRINLVGQASRRFYKSGIQHGVIQGDNTRNIDLPVIVASIQTVARRGMPDCDLIVIDEAHAVAGSKDFRSVIIDRSNVPVIGLTATPFARGMGKHYPELGGELFESLTVATSIRELIADGFLVDCDIYAPSEPDMAGIKTSKNSFGEIDWSDADIGRAVDKPQLVGDIVSHWLRLSNGLSTVCFASNIAHSQHIVESFRAAGVAAEHIDCYTDEAERIAILNRVETGETTVISNVGILCLDERTEILTSDGWVGIDEMSESHLVANWDDGRVFFDSPKEIFRRQRGADEPMYAISGDRSARVTHGHNMVYLSGGKSNRKWGKRKVETLECKAFAFPVGGIAEPFASQEAVQRDVEKRRLIVKRSHHLRANHGYGYDESVAEATRRVDEKYAVAKLLANELSEDHCRFMGLFHADGCASKLKSGGVEYVFCQASNQPDMVAHFQGCFDALGYHNIKNDRGAHIKWSLCRGTGSGCQQRRGVFEIEDYLEKGNLGFLWSLNEAQFDAFLHGFWLGDGNHGDSGVLSENRGFRIYQAQKSVLDQIQAVASVRGYKTNLRGKKNGSRHFIWTLYAKKGVVHSIAGRNSFAVDSSKKSERVWCVKVASGNIITRHNGTVMVMGNCEGWDFPACRTMILARPTKSLIRYIQMIGRVLRPHETKERALVLDHSGTVQRLGFPTDDFPLELDDGKPKETKAAKPEEQLPKVCPQCHAVKPPKTRICPKCGHASQRQSEVETKDGELYLVTKGSKKAKKEDKQQIFSELLAVKCEKGYSDGWLSHKYKAYFGVWPVGMERRAVEPTPEIRSWLVAQNIRFAKSKELRHAA